MENEMDRRLEETYKEGRIQQMIPFLRFICSIILSSFQIM